MESIDALKYPIGKFTPRTTYEPSDLEADIGRIETLPGRLKAAVADRKSTRLNSSHRT